MSEGARQVLVRSLCTSLRLRWDARRLHRHGGTPSPQRGEGGGEGAALSIICNPSPHPSPFGRGSRPWHRTALHHISSTSRSDLQPAQQIITRLFSACSSSLKIES